MGMTSFPFSNLYEDAGLTGGIDEPAPQQSLADLAKEEEQRRRKREEQERQLEESRRKIAAALQVMRPTPTNAQPFIDMGGIQQPGEMQGPPPMQAPQESLAQMVPPSPPPQPSPSQRIAQATGFGASPQQTLIQKAMSQMQQGPADINLNQGNPMADTLSAMTMKSLSADPRATLDPNNTIDNLVINSTTRTGDKRFPTLDDLKNQALMKRMGMDPNTYDPSQGKVPLGRGKTALLVLSEMLSGIAQGSKYKPLNERLQEDADNQMKLLKVQTDLVNSARKNQLTEGALQQKTQAQNQNATLRALGQVQQNALGQVKAGLTQRNQDLMQNLHMADLNVKAAGIENGWDKNQIEAERAKVAADAVLNKGMSPEAAAHQRAVDRFTEDWVRNHNGQPPPPNLNIEHTQEYYQYFLKSYEDILKIKNAKTPSPVRLNINYGGEKINPDGTMSRTKFVNDPISGKTLSVEDVNLGSAQRQLLGPTAVKTFNEKLGQLQDSRDNSEMVMGVLQDALSNPDFKNSVGPLRGNQLAQKLRAMSGGRPVDEILLQQGLGQQLLAAEKSQFGTREGIGLFNKVERLFPAQINDFNDLYKAQAILTTMREMNVKKHAEGLNFANADIFPAVKYSIEKYLQNTANYTKAMDDWKINKPGVPMPNARQWGVKIDTADDIINAAKKNGLEENDGIFRETDAYRKWKAQF